MDIELILIIIGGIIITFPLLLIEDYGYSLLMGQRPILDLLFGQRQDESELTIEDEDKELPTYKEYKEWQAKRPDLPTYKEYKRWLELNTGIENGKNGGHAENGGKNNC